MASKSLAFRNGCLASLLIGSWLIASCVGTPSVPSTSDSGAPSSTQGFGRSSGQLIAQYAGIPVDKDYPYQVLNRELELEYGSDGTLVRRIHAVIRILTPAGVERFSILNAGWQPWRQSRPEIRARVVSPSGNESVLNHASVVEVGDDAGGGNLRTDSRVLSAPMPNLEVNSLLEFLLEERISETRPGAGIGGTFKLGDTVPTEQIKVRISYPANLPVSFAIRGEVSMDRRNGGTAETKEIVLSIGRQPAYAAEEELLPYEDTPVPFLRYGSAQNWQAVAQAYRDATEPFLDPSPVASWARSVLGAVDPTRNPRQAALVLTDAVRSRIRYTGILFGENSIIPHKPSETLSLGYGDCKDQASLLAASLRSAGIESYLALLKSGFSTDSDPAVPGLESFDHAIVFAPGIGLWMDPTATFTPAGELPAGDQRRLALVITAGSKGLVEIPAGERPWYKEIREIQLSSGGRASGVIETTTAGSTAQQELRAHWGRSPREKSLAQLREYGDKAHETKGSSADMADPSDLASPFHLKVSIPNSAQGWTDDNRASFTLRGGALFDPVPPVLKPNSGKAPKRRGDLYVADVPVSEVVYVVKAPPGHRLAYRPEAQSFDLGPARITSSFESPDPSTLLATFRLEFTKERFGPEELKRYLAEADRFLHSKAPVAAFENIGRALMDSGQFKEALSEFHALQERFPKDAVYRMQAAVTLRQAGFPEDAILEAERAVALDPKNPSAHRILAVMLLNDPFGEQFGRGADLARASEEFLAAYRLDPEEKSYIFDRALVLQYGTDGIFWGEGAKLEAALEAYRSEQGYLESEGRAETYIRLLFHMGRYDDILSFSRTLKDTKTGGQYLLAALAVKDGVNAALTRSNALWPDLGERRNALANAGLALLSARQYPQAADCLLASARGTQNFAAVSEFARILSHVRPVVPASVSEMRASPSALVAGLLRTVVLEERLPLELFSSRLRAVQEDTILGGFQGSLEGMKSALRDMGLSEIALIDLITAILDVKSAKVGNVVFATMGFPAFGQNQAGDSLMVEEEGGLAFLGLDGSSYTGFVIWDLYERGRIIEAGRLLEAILSPVSVLPSFTTMPDRSALSLIRPASRTPLDMAVTCAALGGWEFDKSLARKLLQHCLAALEAEPGGERRVHLLSLVLRLAAAAEDNEALEKSARVAEAFDGSAEEFSRLVIDLRRSGAPEHADRVLNAARRRYPDHPGLIRIQANLAGENGRLEEYYRLFSRLTASGAGTTGDYNNQAWGALFLEEVDLEELQGLGFVRRLEEGGAYSAHTVACFLAAAGRYEEARSSFMKLLNMRDELEDISMWTAHGFLALSFGLRDRALQSFRKAAAGEGRPIDSAALARVMLERLERR